MFHGLPSTLNPEHLGDEGAGIKTYHLAPRLWIPQITVRGVGLRDQANQGGTGSIEVGHRCLNPKP